MYFGVVEGTVVNAEERALVANAFHAPRLVDGGGSLVFP